MQLQYPKITQGLSVAHYNDYRDMHEGFIRNYKQLYEDVAGFALLPERFINEAEPIIQQFADKLDRDGAGVNDKLRLQIIADFIERFYIFIDKATEMFTEHEVLAEQTLSYLGELSGLNKLIAERGLEELEDEYVGLIPELEMLSDSLAQIKAKVEFSKKELDILTPFWGRILERMPVVKGEK